jgi:outer membrane protein assembly factor BamD
VKSFFLYIVLILALSACSEYGQVVKKGSVDDKYAMAKRLYAKKDYVRALPLLEDLLAVYRGKEQSEEIYYYYCYSYYGLGQYELAAYHFKNFTENYFNSKHIEECYFRYTNCLYKDALDYFLDQSSTTKAIAEIQLFLNQYANSNGIYEINSSVKTVNGVKQTVNDTITFKDQCNLEMDELRGKLKQKAFESAMLFYKIEDYVAAITSFKNAIKDFPDMDNKDQIEFLTVKASYLYAHHSIDEKKVERYNAVFDEYKVFVNNNKASNTYYKEATAINEKAKEELTKHKTLHKIQ